MSVNRYRPHVMVLPEDRANDEWTTGFTLHPALSYQQIQVLPAAGGWKKVLECFESDHASAMATYPSEPWFC